MSCLTWPGVYGEDLTWTPEMREYMDPRSARIHMPAEQWGEPSPRKELRAVTLRDERGREYPVQVEGGLDNLRARIDRSYEQGIRAAGEPLPTLPIRYGDGFPSWDPDHGLTIVKPRTLPRW